MKLAVPLMPWTAGRDRAGLLYPGLEKIQPGGSGENLPDVRAGLAALGAERQRGEAKTAGCVNAGSRIRRRRNRRTRLNQPRLEQIEPRGTRKNPRKIRTGLISLPGENNRSEREASRSVDALNRRRGRTGPGKPRLEQVEPRSAGQDLPQVGAGLAALCLESQRGEAEASRDVDALYRGRRRKRLVDPWLEPAQPVRTRLELRDIGGSLTAGPGELQRGKAETPARGNTRERRG